MASKLQTKMCLGNLWPLSVYRAHFKKDANKKNVVTVRHQGRVLRGVILDPSHGLAIGVTELSTIGEKGAELDITYDDAEDEMRPGQLADAWKQVSSSCAVTASADKRAMNADGTIDETIPQTATLRKVKKRRQHDGDGSDSDEDLLDELWGEEIFSTKAVDEEDDHGKRAKQKTQRTKPSPSTSTPSRPAAGQKGAVKRAKDMASAEQAVLVGNQFLGMLENPTTVTSITVKALESARKKVTEKLTPTWIAIFTANFDPQQPTPTEEDQGVKFLKDLKDLSAKIQAASGFVEMMNADSKTTKGGASLRLATDEARAAGIALPSVVDEIALTREMKEQLALGNFSTYSGSLCAAGHSCDGLALLPPEGRQAFQDERITRDLCSMMRPEGQAEPTKAFLREVLRAQFLNADLKADLEKLLILFEAEEHDIDAVKKVKTEIETTPSHRFHKLLTLFPTGCAVLEACAKVELVAAADRGFALELQAVRSLASELPDINPKLFEAGQESITISSPPGLMEKYMDFQEGLLKITSSCSGRFRTAHAEDLSLCQAKLDTMKTSLLKWANTIAAEKVEPAIRFIIAASREPAKKHSEKAEVNLVQSMTGKLNKAIDEGFKSASYLGLGRWLPEEQVQAYTSRVDNMKNALNLVKGAIETFVAGFACHLPFNFADSDFIAWMDWVGQVVSCWVSPIAPFFSQCPK